MGLEKTTFEFAFHLYVADNEIPDLFLLASNN